MHVLEYVYGTINYYILYYLEAICEVWEGAYSYSKSHMSTWVWMISFNRETVVVLKLGLNEVGYRVG